MTNIAEEGWNDPPFLGRQIAPLRNHVRTANMPGNLDGLLAEHILGRVGNIGWHVDPTTGPWLEDNAHRLSEPGALAVAGYGLSLRPGDSSDLKALVGDSLRLLMKRDPFPGDRVSFLQDIRILLGVHHAAEAVAADLPEALAWLRSTLADLRLRSADLFHELAQDHVRAAIDTKPIQVITLPDCATSVDLAMILWMIIRGTARLLDGVTDIASIRAQALRAAFLADPSDLTVPQAALLLRVANDAINASIDRLAQGGSNFRMLEGDLRRIAGNAFLAYVREDSLAVDNLQRALEAAGISVWRDTKDLWPGEDWRECIRRAISADSLAFIPCFSQNSLGKVRTHFNEELQLAIDELRLRQRDTPWFFPVRLDDCIIPDTSIGAGRTLASFQYIDIFGEDRSLATTRLAASVIRALSLSSPSQSHP